MQEHICLVNIMIQQDDQLGHGNFRVFLIVLLVLPKKLDLSMLLMSIGKRIMLLIA